MYQVQESQIRVLIVGGGYSLINFFHHDVESVDLLSIDEAYESIGADMPDHNRCRSHVHLFCRIPLNTRRHAREV
jgi:hypothetical protein